MTPHRFARRLAPAALALFVSQAMAQQGPRSLADLSLEELANIEVTSVSRRAEPLCGRAGLDLRDHRRRHPPLRRDDACPRRCGSRPTCRSRAPTPAQYAISARGFNNARRQQAAGADRRAHRLHAAVLRRVLGPAGRDARGHRAHRGDQRPGRDAVGRQRRQRRHQRHHALAADTQGEPGACSARGTAEQRHGAAPRRRRSANGGHYRVYGKARERRGHAHRRAAPRRATAAARAGSAFAPTGRAAPTASRCRATPTTSIRDPALGEPASRLRNQPPRTLDARPRLGRQSRGAGLLRSDRPRGPGPVQPGRRPFRHRCAAMPSSGAALAAVGRRLPLRARTRPRPASSPPFQILFVPQDQH